MKSNTICGNCDYTDGYCYTSIPVKVKCTITGEFHFYNDRCNVPDDKNKSIECKYLLPCGRCEKLGGPCEA